MVLVSNIEKANGWIEEGKQQTNLRRPSDVGIIHSHYTKLPGEAVHGNIVQTSRRLQDSRQEARRECERRHPEDGWRMRGGGPLLELLHTQHEVAGPSCQRLQGWVGLVKKSNLCK